MATVAGARVIAYFQIKKKEMQVKGKIIQTLTVSNHKIYEILTDKPVSFQVRDAEIYLQTHRTTDEAYSLFVSAEQCAPETSSEVHSQNTQNTPPHSQHKSQSTPSSRSSRYKTEDLVTLPVEEIPSGLINGTVGYTGLFKGMDVVEFCADQRNTSSSTISMIRKKYEVQNFPDEYRLNSMRGFSLVVRSDVIIPNTASTAADNRDQSSTSGFSQPVGAGFHGREDTNYNAYDVIPDNIPRSSHANSNQNEMAQYEQQQNQECQILSLSYDDPIAVMSSYHGELRGRFRLIIDFEGAYHVGIEFDYHPPGSSAEWKTPDGVLYDRRIFNCRPGHGALVHISKCVSLVKQRDPNAPLVDKESTLTGAPNLFDNSQITITRLGERFPPLKDVKEIVGQKRGIQGHMNSCYMDSSLFGMFAFSSTFDPLFLKERANEQDPTMSIQRYNHVQEILEQRIVFPLRKAKFVRADQIMMLREELSNAGIIDGLMGNEKDPEEFLKVLLQHVLNADPYIRLRQENSELVNAEYIYQIFSTKQPDVTLPTVQFLLEHSFKEHKVILDSAPHVLILQMPRFGKDFKLYPRIFPSLQLSLDNLTSTTFEPKCIVCTNDATYRCPECENINLFYYKYVFVYFCERCVHIAHERRKDHKFHQLTLQKGAANMPPAKMELFAVLTIETSHYVCFARCKGKWVMFDSMADREGSANGRNIPKVSDLPGLEEWLNTPEKLLDWMASDRSKRNNPIPSYVDRITRDTYLCMYHSEQVNMF